MKAYWDMTRARSEVPSGLDRFAPRRRDGRDKASTFATGADFGHNVLAMNVESRDSVSLKPAELDEFGQLLAANGLPISDEELDRQVESFPLAVVAMLDGELQGLMLGSLERIGGTPSILWGLGVDRKGKTAADDAEGDDR